ncbi:NUDIX domain-containing protein [Streptomyces ferrugineus]|uniref:NUDIX domain-containing protein n=1 Tax=Streptomyces ferrugineus TaxID=1413221 RepID=A0A7M2SV66_9ACTN|nr:NUDIX domain-containing protein [Streptomyces ferrugineus]QOV40162.1 NUDIX domain-containing protein [Streptomyces ferrugineus]
MVDEVNDLVLPGAFTRTLASRPVKSVWHHGWKDPVGVVAACEEWMPGDPRFADIPDWPAEAGALVATVIYNLRTRQGRDAYEQVKQWHEHGQAAFSIGYRVREGEASLRGDGVRVIHHLDLYEVSPVLHGAHPLTRSLEVKSATGGHDGLEYKTTPSHVEIDVVASSKGKDAIKVAGLVVKAADTGRVLMIQRTLDEDDPAAGMWEFPGGHREDGEDPLTAAVREWGEETGSTLPGTASVIGSWTAPNGIYRGFVAVVPTEDSVPINVPHDERRIANPDDPKGDATEVTAWWPITALPDMALLRPECRETPLELLAGAALPQGPAPKPTRPISENVLEGIINATRDGVTSTEKKSARAAVQAARALPRIEHKSARSTVIEAKSKHIAHLEALAMSPKPMPESQEQFRSRLSDKVRELLDQDGGTWTCIEGTYPDRVIVSVHSEDGATERRSSHYAIPYTVTATGDITLEKPQPVELATIVVPEGTTAHRAATEAEDVDARVVQPTVETLADATARVSSSTADPEQFEEVRDKVRDLIAALSAKGLDIAADEDDAAPAERTAAATPLGLALWDEDAFGDVDDGEDDVDHEGAEPARAPEDTVRMDADEVKAALALIRS